MSRLQSKGYSLSLKQKIVLVIVVVVLISVIGFLVSTFKSKNKQVDESQPKNTSTSGSVIESTQSTLITEKQKESVKPELETETETETTPKVETTTIKPETEATTETTTEETTISEPDDIVVTEMLLIIEDGEIYAEHGNNGSHIYYKDISNVIKKLESVENIDYNGSILELNFSNDVVQINSPLIPTFLTRLENVLTNSEFHFGEDWNVSLNQLKIKHEQLNQVPQIEIEELPDTYPASYAHSNIRILSVDVKSFDKKDDAEKYATEELPDKAKELDVSGYIISRGLLNNGEVKYLIYWLK
ncbi:MAG: hypothetical protein WBH77_06820 [Saccharofermentanales bacterium]